MPPIVALALGVLAAAAILRGVVKEVRRMNADLDRVKKGLAIDPVAGFQNTTLSDRRLDAVQRARHPAP
jgi:hypothetical protein